MAKMTLFLCLFMLVFCAAISRADTLTVSRSGLADYATISSAVAAATHDDVILVGEGVYGDTLSPSNITINERLTIIGAGWDKVAVHGYLTITGVGATRAKIVGMRFEYSGSSFVITSGADSVTLDRCLLRGGWSQVSTETLGLWAGTAFIRDCILITQYNNNRLVQIGSPNDHEIRFENCVFANTVLSNTNSAMLYCESTGEGDPGGPVFLYNCVFLNTRAAFNFSVNHPETITAYNCIFFDWAANGSWGTFPSGSVFQYVASGPAGGPAFPDSFGNTVSVPVQPFQVYNPTNNYQYGVSILRLNDFSNGGDLLQDTGAPWFQDLDGTNSDFGVYGGPRPLVDNGVPPFPFVISLDVPGAVQPSSQLNINSVGRVGPHY